MSNLKAGDIRTQINIFRPDALNTRRGERDAVGQVLIKQKQEEYKNKSIRNDKRRDERFMSVEKHLERNLASHGTRSY